MKPQLKTTLATLLSIGTLTLAPQFAQAHECGDVIGKYHTNQDGSKGGFIQSTAFIDSSVYISPNASVCDDAVVLSGKILDYAVIENKSEFNGGIISHLSRMSGGVNNGAIFKGDTRHTSGTIGEGYTFKGTFEYSGQDLDKGIHYKKRDKISTQSPKFLLEAKLNKLNLEIENNPEITEEIKANLAESYDNVLEDYNKYNRRIKELKTQINQKNRTNNIMSLERNLTKLLNDRNHKINFLDKINKNPNYNPDVKKSTRIEIDEINDDICNSISNLKSYNVLTDSSICITREQRQEIKQAKQSKIETKLNNLDKLAKKQFDSVINKYWINGEINMGITPEFGLEYFYSRQINEQRIKPELKWCIFSMNFKNKDYKDINMNLNENINFEEGDGYFKNSKMTIISQGNKKIREVRGNNSIHILKKLKKVIDTCQKKKPILKELKVSMYE
ncbi:MAG: hypothetical protein HRU03_03740 [Nanoarchaeales archaeon]|nr:hypothetical protein [Nanoarchaeales archaeon]